MTQLKTLFLICLAALVLIAVCRALSEVFSRWIVKRRATKLKILNAQLDQLCRELSTYPTARLTSEHIPQRFPSKDAAEAFGKKWSRGGADSFRARALDARNHDEDHPHFDAASIAGGILYTYPALFFGMKAPHQEDDEWFLEFVRAKNRWLKDYLEHLRSGSPS